MVWSVKCDDSGTAREARYVFVTSASTTSFTPTANALLFAFVSNHVDEAPTDISGHDTGTGSQSWTILSSLNLADTDVFVTTWVCMAPDSPSAGTVDLTWDGGGSSGRGTTLIAEVNGHDTTETLANLVVQSDSNTANGTTFTIGLASPLSSLGSGNLLLAAGISGASEVTFAPVAPFTEVFETAGSGSYEIAVHSSETEDTTPEMDVTAVSEYAGLVVLEILAAGAGGGGSIQKSSLSLLGVGA